MDNASATIPTGLGSPNTVQQPAPLPPTPTKNPHVVAITIVILGSVFVVLASIWIFSDTASKTKKALVITPPVVTPTAVPISPTILPPSVSDLIFISKELRSGDPKRVASVMDIDPKKLLPSTTTGFAEIKDLVFDEKTFTSKTDRNHATIKAVITNKNGTNENIQLTFVVKNGKWIIGTGK